MEYLDDVVAGRPGFWYAILDSKTLKHAKKLSMLYPQQHNGLSIFVMLVQW